MLIVLKRVVPEENMDRWYMVTVQATLLHPLAVICAYGSRHTAWQQMRIFPADSWQQAVDRANDVVAQKRKRGYEVVLVSEPLVDEAI
jgi:predicted DNA-binding WGR domain protein